MIKIWISTNDDKWDKNISSSMTPKELLTEEKVNFSSAQATLDGCFLSPAQMNMTFEELGIKDEAYLSCVAKHDNATAA